MPKNSLTELEAALQTISSYSYNTYQDLLDGLPSGNSSDMGFDDQLVIDIARAFISWQSRLNEIKDPYCVWYYDGNDWSKVTKDLYQEDAYKEWYRLTQGGKKNNKASCEMYYFLGPSSLKLFGRHDQPEEGDDFSIRYLLAKSFGE